jgi:hypothetical protein
MVKGNKRCTRSHEATNRIFVFAMGSCDRHTRWLLYDVEIFDQPPQEYRTSDMEFKEKALVCYLLLWFEKELKLAMLSFGDNWKVNE